ncbi:PHD finger protein 20-like isoform X2 [Daphnia pulex]|uniref:PHD finger protein 20-like isoform X2 n=1 Tax=Daphnia pulex TaxID=6669 RepID=UPI001EE0C956|nr:PHD finger protein 20-like isoform X2 [Daphnia pulex]
MASSGDPGDAGTDNKPSTSSGRKGGRNPSAVKIDFVPGSLLEARDFANNWFPSKVVEVDDEGREVLVHFQNWSSRYDEWISMDSARLRPVTNQSEKICSGKASRGKDFKVGEKVMAVWHNNKRYPAQITKVLEPGNFEVIFYDGFSMQVKAKQMSRMPKEQADKMIPFPKQMEAEKDKNVDMEEIGSKEERRKRKKKIEVSELFRCYKKRPSNEGGRDGGTPNELILKEEEKDSVVEAAPTPTPTTPLPVEKKKKKKKEKKERTLIKDHGDIIKLLDEKLPEGWEKKAKFKPSASKAGKWDVVIIGPDGRTFRSKQEIRQYLFIRQLDHDLELFDFRLGENFYTSRGLEVPVRARKSTIPTVRTPTAPVKKQETAEVTPATTTALAPSESITVPVSATPTHVDSNGADKTSTNKLPIKSESIAGPSVETETPTFVPEEDGYRCPVEDCRKLFRRDNLLGMHIKHYHPALLKKLGCKTFRVEDLAAARTAFETEETKPIHVSHSHSILASILTLPPQTSPSPPPPRLRSSLERRLEKEKEKPADSPASDDIQNLPLSKRLSLSESQQKPGSNAPAKTTRRKSDKRRVDYPVEETPLYLPESEPEIPPIDFESKTCGLEDLQQQIKIEEPIVSTLDDIPGQKELVHCFCGSPEEDGLMIQCELCLCWQHGVCLAIDSEENVPDPYVCHFCRYPFRERLSRRYTHDQTWLKKGHLPSLKFISGSSSVPADRTLRVAHTLTAAATDLKQLLHSLKVKIDVAKNKDHPKLYLWAQPWIKKTESEPSSQDVPSNVEKEETKSMVPNVPLPETPIDVTDCRLNLLLHIGDMQNEVNTRLESLEGLFEECEMDDGLMDTSHVAKMLQILLKDVVTLKRMASFNSWSS